VFDVDDLTGSTFSAATVSATEVAVKGTGRQCSHREFTHRVRLIGWPAGKQRGAFGAPDARTPRAWQSAHSGARGVTDELHPVAVPAELHRGA
jgi:hypothetical protein